jgi:hypothetical protein
MLRARHPTVRAAGLRQKSVKVAGELLIGHCPELPGALYPEFPEDGSLRFLGNVASDQAQQRRVADPQRVDNRGVGPFVTFSGGVRLGGGPEGA